MSAKKDLQTDDKIEQLLLRPIEVEALIKNPLPGDPFLFMSYELPKLKREREVIKEQLSFLLKNREAEKNVKARNARELHQSKQEIIHKEIESMRRRRPNATNTELFEALAEKRGKETRML